MLWEAMHIRILMKFGGEHVTCMHLQFNGWITCINHATYFIQYLFNLFPQCYLYMNMFICVNRFNYESRFWTKLHGVQERPQWYGRSAVLSPFGMITSGGLKAKNGRSYLESLVLIHNLMNETTSELKVEYSRYVKEYN